MTDRLAFFMLQIAVCAGVLTLLAYARILYWPMLLEAAARW